jgi:hypothetical protein
MAVSVPIVRRLLLCLTAVIVVSACGDDRVQSPAAANVPAVEATSPTGTAAVPDTLAFSAPRVGGGTIDFSQFAGTPLLVWFWAPT